MKAITLTELKQNTDTIIRDVAGGRSLAVKYQGKIAVRLEPIVRRRRLKSVQDPFYSLATLAAKKGDSLSNAQIDELIYGA